MFPLMRVGRRTDTISAMRDAAAVASSQAIDDFMVRWLSGKNRRKRGRRSKKIVSEEEGFEVDAVSTADTTRDKAYRRLSVPHTKQVDETKQFEIAWLAHTWTEKSAPASLHPSMTLLINQLVVHNDEITSSQSDNDNVSDRSFSTPDYNVAEDDEEGDEYEPNKAENADRAVLSLSDSSDVSDRTADTSLEKAVQDVVDSCLINISHADEINETEEIQLTHRPWWMSSS